MPIVLTSDSNMTIVAARALYTAEQSSFPGLLLVAE